MHIDTGHNCDEVIAFRDQRAAELGEKLIVRSVEDSIKRGSVVLRRETDSRNAAQAVTLLEAIEEFGFDACIGGARRDEEKARAKERKREGVPDGQRWVSRLAQAAQGSTSDVVKRAGFRLAASYLQSMKNNLPLDAVARFHLGNGARIERLNWAADTSQKGLKQSCGLMVNYLYDLDELDTNLAKLGEGKPQVSRRGGRGAGPPDTRRHPSRRKGQGT
ncbi:hypothetical protein G6F40_014128 [Rhizopus arrhizus]|nr:hypothetical protein G6F40_014128 [Rhizopus arrhizus]